MTSLQFAILFNVTETAVVVILSLAVTVLLANSFFRFWTLGFAFGLLATLIELGTTLYGWQPPFVLAVLLVAQASSLSMVTAGWHFLGKRLPRPLPWAYGLMALVQVLLIFLVKLPFALVVLPSIVLLACSFMWLGGCFWRIGFAEGRFGMFWMAIPLTIHGLWVLTYPLIVPSAYAFIGYWVMGVLQCINGIGMMVYVLHEGLAEQRRLSEQTRAQNQRLQELDSLKNSFVSTVSHELRTPLASIKGYAEFLEDDLAGALAPDQRHYVAEILAGGTRLERLVDDLLDFARLESGSLKLILHEGDFSRTVQAVLHTMQPQAIAKQILLSAQAPEAPVVFAYDDLRIEQVLMNLVGNAIKFTPPEGRITVSVRREASAVRVEVRDTGIGVAPENLPKLFGRFYQVDPTTTRQSGGVGLGLSIVKALVEAHGGRIGAESAPGAGSTFWFELPLAGAGRATESEGDVSRQAS